MKKTTDKTPGVRRRGRRVTAQKEGVSSAIENISIVLVEPRGPGNVGSVARAMMNNGFKKLRLVAPCDYHNNEAYSMACKADGLLLAAPVYDRLEACLEDASIVVGTTRRKGRIRHPVMSLGEAAPRILELAVANEVFILFGREDRGLGNDEVLACDILVEIPSSEAYPSLNLSHAAFIVCHSLFTVARPPAPSITTAPRAELDGMYGHMEEALRSLGYGEQGGEYLLTTILRNFKRLYGRAGLMRKEVNMLRGIFTQIIERTGAKDERR
ncbi:MAG: RNA methyltransferase [Deltaproteobacteria bacterium]|nr:RNA methyltransferase [Deltaproteobacteria bacterium]